MIYPALLLLVGAVSAHQAPFHIPLPGRGPILGPIVRAEIATILRVSNVPGYSLAVYRQGAKEEVEYGQWGSMAESGEPVAADASTLFLICELFTETFGQTIFGIGSMSKAFTALALGLVMDDFKHGRNVTPLPGNLTEFMWDTKLTDLLSDEWRLEDETASETAEVRDILSHVSGLARSASWLPCLAPQLLMLSADTTSATFTAKRQATLSGA
jgi:CubicO group peptidase (beta-lactamase class C family)